MIYNKKRITYAEARISSPQRSLDAVMESYIVQLDFSAALCQGHTRQTVVCHHAYVCLS